MVQRQWDLIPYVPPSKRQLVLRARFPEVHGYLLCTLSGEPARQRLTAIPLRIRLLAVKYTYLTMTAVVTVMARRTQPQRGENCL